MNWFTRLTGFAESTRAAVHAQLEVDGNTLRSRANGRSYQIGEFEMASLADLRARVAAGTGAEGRLRISIVTGDVRKLHQAREYAGALFQVASQFNALEMPDPGITPEEGVTHYETDRTQGRPVPWRRARRRSIATISCPLAGRSARRRIINWMGWLTSARS
jgi:hypothetical protein